MDSQDQITYIGKVDHRNKMTKFGIKPKDRTKHMYIIGKTGTGKSTFLENMIVQDIQNGHGVAFIDPHGGSAEKLLDYIPEWRINDVIYFNPSDMEHPIAFNPLEDPGPEKRHLVTDGLMSVFKKIWPEAFSGRMEYILNMTMMALMEYPDSTVLSINRMLTDKDFRKKVVAGVTDTAVRNAWDELMKWDDKRWSEAIGALVNKVGQFSTNPVIRNIIGQAHSTFDFRKAMDERKIVIINLSKGQIGEQNAPLLGAMLITKIYLSAMSRAELQGHVIDKMPPFYFYVDEFQNFANESFASILSEARKYKLCLTVANQFIAQMEETIRDAVFGNMGTVVSFRVGPLDAEFMEKVFAPVFTQEDLQNIMFGQYYLTLQIDNMGSKPFSAQGLAPIPPLMTSMRQQVIEASRVNFAAKRTEVEEAVKEFFGYDKAKTIHSEPVSQSPRSENRYEGSSAPRTYDAARPAAPKPIPAISGYKKDNQVLQAPKKTFTAPQQSQAPRPVVQNPPAPKNSDSLNELLGKLDDVAIIEPRKSAFTPKPRTEEKVPDSKIVKPEPVEQKIEPKPVAQPVGEVPVVTPQVAKPSTVRPVDQKLTRVASTEQKSALQEILAKAMAQKQQVSTPKPPITETVQQIIEKNEPVVVAAPVIAPVSAPVVPVPVSEAVPPPVTVPTAVPVITEPVVSSFVPKPLQQQQQTTTIREVPEDILRKVLE